MSEETPPSGRASPAGHPPAARRADDDDALGLMTPGEVAAILHVDANTLARWADNGKLRAVRTPGGHRRYYVRDVLDLVRGGTR